MLGVELPPPPVSTGNSITAGVAAAVALVDCPVPGPGVTEGGADSGGPWGVATGGTVIPGLGVTEGGADSGGPWGVATGGTVIPGLGVTEGGADSGGPAGFLTVGICPVDPGPGATAAGNRSIGLVTTSAAAPVSTGLGPCVAILLSFSYDTDI